jgi:TolB-like protein
MVAGFLCWSATVAGAPGSAARFLVLPFGCDSLAPDLTHLDHVVPEMLTVYLSQVGGYAVVARRELDLLREEYALELKGLASEGGGPQLGRVAGATVMVTGECFPDGDGVLLHARAIDVASGGVLSSRQSRGSLSEMGETVYALYRGLVEELDRRVLEPGGQLPDPSPVAGLHFLRGLGFYYSAQYDRALSEFLQVSPGSELEVAARLWMANAYLAVGEYDHAYLELQRLGGEGVAIPLGEEIRRKKELCLGQLAAEQVQWIDGMNPR